MSQLEPSRLKAPATAVACRVSRTSFWCSRALWSPTINGSSTASAKKSFDIRGGRCQPRASAGVRASLSSRVARFSAVCGGSLTSAGGGGVPRGMLPKCFSASARTSAAVVSPTTTSTALLGA